MHAVNSSLDKHVHIQRTTVTYKLDHSIFYNKYRFTLVHKYGYVSDHVAQNKIKHCKMGRITIETYIHHSHNRGNRLLAAITI